MEKKNKYSVIMVACILVVAAIDAINQQDKADITYIYAEHPGSQHNGFIGFTAWNTVTQSYESGDRIYFQGLITNDSIHYDPSLSEFVCPVQGVYFVSVNLKRFEDTDIYVQVMKDLDYIMYLRDYELNPENTYSNNVLVECEVGSVIYVEGAADGNVFGDAEYPHTTFTVMLLQEQDGNKKHDSMNGFSIYKEDDQAYDFEDLIEFTEVIYNDGNYDIETSSYSCIQGGLYYVSVTLRMNWFEALQLSLDKSGVQSLDAFDVSGLNPDSTITNNRLLVCETGEILTVKATGEGDIYGSSSLPLTTFSAMFIGLLGVYSNENDRLHESIIGFSMSKNENQAYASNETITYDQVLWDDYGYFDNNLNQFTCPQNGLYFVSVNYKRLNVLPLHLDVVKDGVTFLRSTDDNVNNPWNNLSNSGLVDCLEGESIWVMATGGGSLYGDENYITTFTVVMMYGY